MPEQAAEDTHEGYEGEPEVYEELFRTLLRASPDEIAMTDLRGNLTRASGAGLKMFGLARMEDAIGRNIAEFIVPEQRVAVVRRFASMQHGVPGPSEYEAIGPGGKRFWIEVNGAVLHDHEGRPKGMLFIVRDVSSRKEIAMELERSEERLALANRKLTLLGSMTRHDILNKITVLNGNVELAMMASEKEAANGYLEKVKKASTAIQHLLEASRAYQQLGTTEPEWIDINSAMRLDLASIDAGPVEIAIDLPEVEVLGDQLFSSCIRNLVDNALRHGGEVGQITITGKEGPSNLVISVEDDGQGIPIDQKEKIFEWNYSDRAGHGLNFVREALNSIGMTIREVGAEGRGARFEITVPPGNYRSK